MKEVKLDSGAVLKISQIPFAEAKALYKAVLEEMKSVQISASKELSQVIKDVFCYGFSSAQIEAALEKCFMRCTYNLGGRGDLKIDATTFESELARADYVKVCVEVLQEVLAPFMKGLYAEFSRASQMIPGNQS